MRIPTSVTMLTDTLAAIAEIRELNIGHAIVAQALFTGFDRAVRDMKALMVEARRAA